MNEKAPEKNRVFVAIIIFGLVFGIYFMLRAEHLSEPGLIAQRAKCSFAASTVKTILENTDIKTAANSKQLAELIGMGFEGSSIENNKITVKNKFNAEVTKKGACQLGEKNCFFVVNLDLKPEQNFECKIYIDDSGIIKLSKQTKKLIN